MFDKYLEEITNQKDVKTLKQIAHEIYNSEGLSRFQKRALLQVYKAKIQFLYNEEIQNSESQIFKSLYYLMKKYSGPEVGKLMYAVQDKLSVTEKDILFTEYEKRKFTKKETDNENNNIEPF